MNIDNLASRAGEDPHNVLLRLELARGCLYAGEEGRARDLVLRYRNAPTGDFSIHRGWGNSATPSAWPGRQRSHTAALFKEKPGDVETLYRLGLLFSETGHYEKAVDILGRTLKRAPEHAKAGPFWPICTGSLGFQARPKRSVPSRPAQSPLLLSGTSPHL